MCGETNLQLDLGLVYFADQGHREKNPAAGSKGGRTSGSVIFRA